MGHRIDFQPISADERDQLTESLRRNAAEGSALRMDPLTTGWVPGEDEITDDTVIDAIRSVPCHYAGDYHPVYREGALLGFAPPGGEYDPDLAVVATKATGQTCVGEVRLSALDVGFDLRAVGQSVKLPAAFASAGIDYDGATYLIEGTPAALTAVIRAAGYAVSNPA